MVTEEDIKRIYGKEFDYEKVIGTECYLDTLQDNQLVMWGDGKTYYWRLTKKAIVEGVKTIILGRIAVCRFNDVAIKEMASVDT